MKGSITKRVGASGRVTWTCVIDLPPDPVTKKRRQRRLSAPTRKALEALQAKTLHELQTGAYVEPSTVTLAAYLARWLEAAEPTIRPSTYDLYRRIIARHLTPGIGALPLGALTPLHIQQHYAEKLTTLKPATVRQQHAILHRALDQAIKWRLLVRNPTEAVDPPRVRASELTTWTAPQARAFLDGTADDALAALWRLALTTGMRQGELLALRWQDVDLDRGNLAVRRTLTRDRAGRWAVGDPKSAAGRRSLALPPACVAALKRHKAQQTERRLQWGAAWQDGGLIFDRGGGGMLTPSTLKYSYRRLLTRLDLPVIRFHDLRHTAATLMLAEGIHPKIVAERLGHSAISMTLDRYSHVSMDMQREAADRLERALGG